MEVAGEVGELAFVERRVGGAGARRQTVALLCGAWKQERATSAERWHRRKKVRKVVGPKTKYSKKR